MENATDLFSATTMGLLGLVMGIQGNTIAIGAAFALCGIAVLKLASSTIRELTVKYTDVYSAMVLILFAVFFADLFR